MKINKYFLLHNKKLKPWIKYWLYIKSKDKNYVLSDILEGTSFYLENSSNKKFNLFQINGNSIQNGTPTPTNPVEIKSAGDNNIKIIISNNDNTQSQSYIIPCQQPMRSIGNVRDGFVKIDGVWYEKHNIGQVVLNGSRDWVKSTYSNEKYFCAYLAYGISNSIVGSFTINDRFQIGYYVDVLDKECMSSMPQLHVRILASRLTENSVNAFKTWLSTHNTEVIYQLAEPIYLECTQEQVQVLESITQSHTYKHITNINSTDITPAFLKIQYYMEV